MPEKFLTRTQLVSFTRLYITLNFSAYFRLKMLQIQFWTTVLLKLYYRRSILKLLRNHFLRRYFQLFPESTLEIAKGKDDGSESTFRTTVTTNIRSHPPNSVGRCPSTRETFSTARATLLPTEEKRFASPEQVGKSLAAQPVAGATNRNNYGLSRSPGPARSLDGWKASHHSSII